MSSEISKDGGLGESRSEEIAEKIKRIEASLLRESWLPISLRGLLATELPMLSAAIRTGGAFWRSKVAGQVLALALASWAYGPSPLESETISQLRALDLELSESETLTLRDFEMPKDLQD